MKTYTVTVTQTEARTYVLPAESKEAAIALAEAWAEERSGECPEHALAYAFYFDSKTEVKP